MSGEPGGSGRHKVRRRVAGGVLVVVLTTGGLTIHEYSAPPTAEKDCATHAQAPAGTYAVPEVAAPFPGELTDRGGTVNDASCLNRTPVYGVAHPVTEKDLARALAFAREHDLTVAVAGTRHSMGGQSSFPGALVLDMTGMDRIIVDAAASTVLVEAGATWRQVLEAVHPEDLAVAAMPSIDVLSVGGTISSNAHGVDFRAGSLANTVRSLRIMLADGTVHRVDREHQPELFAAAIGGYGLLGVIVAAELDLVPSETYIFRQQTVDYRAFPALFATEIEPDERKRLMYAHLATSPGALMREAIVYTYERPSAGEEPVPPLQRAGDSRFARLMFNLARTGPLGQEVKWRAQRDLLPHLRTCRTSRNEALREAEACLVSRNQAMYNGLGLLENRLDRHTDILQEYFLPSDQLVPFLDQTRRLLIEHDAVLLSASIRVVHRDEVMLSYAGGDRFSLVLYLSQKVTDEGNEDMASLTRALVEAAIEHRGSFYLPYQQHYTPAQLQQAYPRLPEFLTLKDSYDPQHRFANRFSSRYGQP